MIHTIHILHYDFPYWKNPICEIALWKIIWISVCIIPPLTHRHKHIQKIYVYAENTYIFTFSCTLKPIKYNVCTVCAKILNPLHVYAVHVLHEFSLKLLRYFADTFQLYLFLFSIFIYCVYISSVVEFSMPRIFVWFF